MFNAMKPGLASCENYLPTTKSFQFAPVKTQVELLPTS